MLNLSQEKNAGDDGFKMIETLRPRVLDAHYQPGGLIDFPAYVMDPRFEVKQVVRTTDPGGTAIKFFFRYFPSQPKEPNIEGWVRLEGESDWVIRDYELEVTFRGVDQEKKSVELVSKRSGSILYKPKDGLSVPSEIKYREERSTGTVEDSTFQIENFALGPTPEEEFTLAAFGLGDFARPTARSTHQGTYYLAIFGVAALS